MASPFHYPTFRRKVESMARYVARRKRDLVQLNNISGTELAQLNTLDDALHAVATGDGWPKYGERP